MEEEDKDECYKLDGFKACFFASKGHGKGLAVYVKEGVDHQSTTVVSLANIQLIKITMAELDIITVYRSADEREPEAARLLGDVIDPDKDTLVVGDMNYCDGKGRKDLAKFFARRGFTQLVTLPTHIRGGIYSEGAD